MSVRGFVRSFFMRGVFWRQLLSWASVGVPFFFEPLALWLSALFFYVSWSPGRKGVNANLSAIFPSSSRVTNWFRGCRVFINFAWSITDAARFTNSRTVMDWEVRGISNLRKLLEADGAIILTAHMGNYDLGSFLFSEKFNRSITTVRAPEVDPETERHAVEVREKLHDERLKVNYSTDPSSVAISMIQALRRGEIVAIQGDRAIAGVSLHDTRLFSKPVALPAGPFALATTTQKLIFPLFVIRVARRRYRVIILDPIEATRVSRERLREITPMIERWRDLLEGMIREHWDQWFMFEHFSNEEKSS